MPVQVTVRVSGADIVRKGLEDLRSETPKIGAQRIYEAMQRARKKVITYPPQLAGQRYKRTGTYGRAWDVVRNLSASANSAGWSLVGEAIGRRGREYTKYVSGSAYGTMQAGIHARRWTLARDAVDEEVTKLPKTIREHILQIARRENL